MENKTKTELFVFAWEELEDFLATEVFEEPVEISMVEYYNWKVTVNASGDTYKDYDVLDKISVAIGAEIVISDVGENMVYFHLNTIAAKKFNITYRNIDGIKITKTYNTPADFMADVNDTNESNIDMPSWDSEVLLVKDGDTVIYSALNSNKWVDISSVYRFFSRTGNISANVNDDI